MRRRTAFGVGIVISGIVAGCTVLPGNITYRDGGGGDGGGGATGSSTSSDSSSSSTGTGGAPACSATVSDELNGPSLDPCWTVLEPARIASQSFTTTASMTAFSLAPTKAAANGWFQDDHGPFVYQMVKGDFILVARVFVGLSADPGMPPLGLYSTGGLLARDPASTTGNENWLLYDLGRQGASTDTPNVDVGAMAKITVASVTTKYPKMVGGSHAGAIALCRVGDTFQALQHLYMPDGPFEIAHTYAGWTSPPQALQVGLIAGSWMSQSDVVARFDYARFGDPGGDCATAFQAIAAQMP